MEIPTVDPVRKLGAFVMGVEAVNGPVCHPDLHRRDSERLTCEALVLGGAGWVAGVSSWHAVVPGGAIQGR